MGFKSVVAFPYQCSRHSAADEIERRFIDALTAQEKQANTNAVVFLDEVGLAEESPHLPLKVLHKLLEKPTVSFIGLSNWDLDPAKMNRAIYLVRPESRSDDLCETAKAIIGKDNNYLNDMMNGLAASYIDITKMSGDKYRDFIGLRDFYTFVKLLNRMVMESEDKSLRPHQFNEAIHR